MNNNEQNNIEEISDGLVFDKKIKLGGLGLGKKILAILLLIALGFIGAIAYTFGYLF